LEKPAQKFEMKTR